MDEEMEMMLRKTACAVFNKSQEELTEDDIERFKKLIREANNRYYENFHWSSYQGSCISSWLYK